MTLKILAKKPSKIPESEKPVKLPSEEPVQSSWPIKEPEIKPVIEPSVSFNPPKEIPL